MNIKKVVVAALLLRQKQAEKAFGLEARSNA